MEEQFDIKTVYAIICSSLFLIIFNIAVWQHGFIPSEWGVFICILVVTAISGTYGAVTGLIVPIASCATTAAIFSSSLAVEDMIILVIIGAVTGYYSKYFEIRTGTFSKKGIIDFVIIEFAVNVFVWMLMRPMGHVMYYMSDVRLTIRRGFVMMIISLGVVYCICIPLLLLVNSLFTRRRTMSGLE